MAAVLKKLILLVGIIYLLIGGANIVRGISMLSYKRMVIETPGINIVEVLPSIFENIISLNPQAILGGFFEDYLSAQKKLRLKTKAQTFLNKVFIYNKYIAYLNLFLGGSALLGALILLKRFKIGRSLLAVSTLVYMASLLFVIIFLLYNFLPELAQIVREAGPSKVIPDPQQREFILNPSYQKRVLSSGYVIAGILFPIILMKLLYSKSVRAELR